MRGFLRRGLIVQIADRFILLGAPEGQMGGSIGGQAGAVSQFEIRECRQAGTGRIRLAEIQRHTIVDAAAAPTVADGTVTWRGAAHDWGLRRMILHNAHLCALAGGVDAFLIGSEMRGLTQIRSTAATYPAVSQFRSLAAAVRQILGPTTKISYAADWSEYFGHHPSDGSNDVFFHLDPLWADPNIDFIGIDNYMPLSDWRDGWLALIAATLLFILGARRSGEQAGRAAERLQQTERTNDALRRMLEAGADRPRDGDDLAQRLRDGRF